MPETHVERNIGKYVQNDTLTENQRQIQMKELWPLTL